MDRLEENALTFALTKLGDNGGFARSRAAVGCVQPYSFQKKRQGRRLMKRITLSFADSLKYNPPFPERTAKRSISWDVEFQTWPSRAAMEKTIQLQGKRASHYTDWKPVEK